jgi:hypothetical protein
LDRLTLLSRRSLLVLWDYSRIKLLRNLLVGLWLLLGLLLWLLLELLGRLLELLSRLERTALLRGLLRW